MAPGQKGAISETTGDSNPDNSQPQCATEPHHEPHPADADTHRTVVAGLARNFFPPERGEGEPLQARDSFVHRPGHDASARVGLWLAVDHRSS